MPNLEWVTKKDADPFSVRLPWTSYSSLKERSPSTADTYLEVFLNYAKRGAFEVCKLVSSLGFDTLCFPCSPVMPIYAFEVNTLFSNYAQFFLFLHADISFPIVLKHDRNSNLIF